MDNNLMEQVKSISLAVIALSLFVQTVMNITGPDETVIASTVSNNNALKQDDPHAGHDHNNSNQNRTVEIDPLNQQDQQSNQPQLPPTTVEFDESEHDFGTIGQNEKVKHTFTFTNTGEEPLLISNAKGSCGCTVPAYPKEPIAPGEKGEIEVEFSSGKFTGLQNKTVTINANTEPTVTRLNIKAKVDPALNK